MTIVNNVKERGIGGAMGELGEKTRRTSVLGQMAFLGIRGASGRNDNPAGFPSFARSPSPFIIALTPLPQHTRTRLVLTSNPPEGSDGLSFVISYSFCCLCSCWCRSVARASHFPVSSEPKGHSVRAFTAGAACSLSGASVDFRLYVKLWLSPSAVCLASLLLLLHLAIARRRAFVRRGIGHCLWLNVRIILHAN